MFAVDHVILISAVLAILGVLASKLSPRFGVPVLVLFLGVGMLAGEDGIGRIFFDIFFFNESGLHQRHIQTLIFHLKYCAPYESHHLL